MFVKLIKTSSIYGMRYTAKMDTMKEKQEKNKQRDKKRSFFNHD